MLTVSMALGLQMKGHRFNNAKLLLDPYARAISRMPVWDDSLFGHDRNRDDRVLNPEDNASYAPVGCGD